LLFAGVQAGASLHTIHIYQKAHYWHRGKSTLLATLLRLLELQSGTIEIDGIDIKEVRLDLLRRRCFIAVSQDPLVLSNETLRFNLDPDSFEPDEIIIGALSKAGIWSHFSAGDAEFDREVATFITIPGIGEHPILDQKISQLKELSAGQCQLLALSRALVKASYLRRSGVKPVVVLDEVTSSLDSDTESTIYRIINDEFTERNLTVIIVAHRLSVLTGYTKIGRDAVVLMADGVLQSDEHTTFSFEHSWKTLREKSHQ
jgi:ATP-binding cassette subfamily C (CFTR/MRP) protein 1